jgi:ABC-2 type transport system permease protein
MLVMPAVLILIMALVQDAPFRDYQDIHFDLLVADEDGGPLSTSIRETLGKTKAFTIVDQLNGKALDKAGLKEGLRTGKYSIGLFIPKGANAEVVNAANTVANSLSGALGTGTLPQREPRDYVAIRLLFDPVSRPAFRMAILAAIDKAVSSASSKQLLSRIHKLAGDTTETANSLDLEKLLSGLAIREEQAEAGEQMASKNINSVQHNVPAWAIFGMFFIVVPFSGHIIRERVEGSALRIRLIPGVNVGTTIGRILANTIVCCLQFLAMCAVGLWILPLVGLPQLSLGNHPAAIIPVVIATALCATAFGNLIGTLFNSNTSALSFGAISIVILSALGGIWVPVELLPPVLQTTAKLSPLHWALQGIQSVVLREGSWGDVMLPVTILTTLAVLLWLGSVLREKKVGAGL